MKTTIIIPFVFLFALFSCNHQKEQKDEEQKRKQEIQRRQARDIQFHKGRYKTLCFIGESRWGSFQEYYDFVKVEANWKQLFDELEQSGYNSQAMLEIDLGLGYKEQSLGLWDTTYPRMERDSNRLYRIELSKDGRAFLFIEMRNAGVNVGSYKEFLQSLENMEDFVWYYKKCKSLGLVRGWFQFISMMFEPDEEWCKELWYDDWESEWLEKLHSDRELFEDYFEEEIEDERKWRI